MATTTLTAATFEETVLGDGTFIVDFWAEWCGPCRGFAPVFEAASDARLSITFAKVDTEAEQELAGALGIQSIPTLMAFRDGVLLYREAGALGAPAFDALLDQIQELDMDEVRAEIAQRQDAG